MIATILLERVRLLSLITINIFVLSCQILGQSTIGNPQNFPNLIIDVSDKVKAKAYLPKKRFRFSELIILDVALLVTAELDYYFPKELNYRIRVTDKQGRSIETKNLISNEQVPTMTRQSETIITTSSLILIGCDNRVLQDLEDSLHALSDDNNLVEFYNLNLFRTSPTECINLDKPIELFIWVEIFNDLVFVQENNPIKSAVFKLQSNKLKVKIDK